MANVLFYLDEFELHRLLGIEARLTEARLSPSKAWRCLCIVATSSDSGESRHFWESHRAHPNAFLAEVAVDLLAHGRPGLAGASNA